MSSKYVSDGIDKCLEKYGESLKPPTEFIDEGRRLAQNVSANDSYNISFEKMQLKNLKNYYCNFYLMH